MDVYSFPPSTLPRRNVRFHIAANYPLTVAVATVGDFVVIGGEDGHARLYNTRVGVIDGMLPHGNRAYTTPSCGFGIHFTCCCC